jgi:DNA invertase Pin-like site-specific DNA recombinase
MAIYGYARCSTGETRQDIERQTRELTAQGASQIFSEYISGTAEGKPELGKLLAATNPGDTIIATEVSRLGRSIHQLCHTLESIQDKQAKLVCGALSLDFTTGKPDPMTRAMFCMMGIFAELERGVTIERIRSGIANAKSKGTPMGRPRKTVAQIPEAVTALLPEYQAGKLSKTECAKKAGIARPSLYKYLRLLGHG